MTLQINQKRIICDETYRKLLINTFPEDFSHERDFWILI